MGVYRSVVEWQRPGAPEWSCDSLLLLRFTPELLQALQEVVPALRVAPLAAPAGRAGGAAAHMKMMTPPSTTMMSYAEVEQAQAAYQRVNGTPSSGLGAVLAQLQGLRGKGLSARFVFWQSEG
jgi:hypothetical protein